jgi:hypothetical protein
LSDLVPDICLVGLLTVDFSQLRMRYVLLVGCCAQTYVTLVVDSELLGGGLGTRVHSALLFDQPVAVKVLEGIKRTHTIVLRVCVRV